MNDDGKFVGERTLYTHFLYSQRVGVAKGKSSS